MCFRSLRFVVLMLAAGAMAADAFADRAAELARIHVEAIGGRQRIQALFAFRATGEVVTATEQARFTLTAARPNRVRMETRYAERTLVQGTDGVSPPWELDPAIVPPRYTTMAPDTAATFLADVEFDDPLVGGEERGYRLEFGGEVEIGGQKLLRLLVSRKLTETFFLFLDPETYFIVLRVEQSKTPGGRAIEIVTRYEDFRPVEGVLVAHEVSVFAAGKLSQRAKIDRIEANPRIRVDTFSSPATKPAATNR